MPLNNSFKIKSLQSFINYIVRKWWWLFLITGLSFGVFGIYHASKIPVKYKSSLTFALDDGGGNQTIGNFMSLASQFGINVGSGQDIFGGDNILEIVKSRRMIEHVLLTIDTFENKPYTLIEYFLLINKKFKDPKEKDIHFPINLERNRFSYQQDSVLYLVYNEIANSYIEAQRPDKKLSIYEVNVTSTDEKFTKDFTDRIVKATNDFYTEIRTKKEKEILSILEDRLAQMKGNLDSSLNDKAILQDQNLNPAFSSALVPITKQQQNIQVYGTAYSEIFKNLEVARFQYLNEIPLMQIIDDANYPMEKIRVGKLKTGIIFSSVSCILLLFIFWLIRIVKLSSSDE